MLVAAGILLSRLSGLVRQKIFAHYLGNSDAAGVFSAAYRIPNFLQNLFGEGVLSASFIPVYAKLLAQGEDKLAGRVAGIVASLLALTVAVLVLICVLITPWLLIIIAPGFHGEVRELTIRVVRILFPGIGILVMSAWCLGVLNSHRKFFLSYVAPVLMNIVMIATLVIFGHRVNQTSLAICLAWGTVVGAGAQLGIQVPFVFRYARHLKFAIETTLEPVRQVVRNFTPVVIGRGVVQLSAYLDNILATLLGTAAASALAYAQLISLLPISLFGMSVAAAELPQMSAAIGSDEEIHAALRTRMSRGLRQIAFFVIPSVVAFVALGKAIVAALYQGGTFTGADTIYVWYILIGSTVGLLAVTLGRLYSSAFYALGDTKTPLRFAMIRVALTGALGWIFAIPLRPLLLDGMRLAHVPLPLIHGTYTPLGAIALTATAGIAGWLEFMLLRWSLGRRIGAVPLSRAFLGKLWTSAIAAGAASAAFFVYVTPRLGAHLPRVFPHVRDGIIVCGLFGVIYFGATMALNVPESRATLGRFLLRSRS
ncbi:MAG TPA: murein biosynthesis integral membrane protein MurJ [Thermoanaerobaculia bacterium]|nr:murein biosynthesis integral membrane protein MurJ [Thermoanaerobaculia bacterium]